jgi:Cu-Zn family superoxide dismutase
MKKTLAFLAAAAIMFTGTAFAAEIVVQMNLIDEQGVGKAIGTVTITEGPSGLVLTPALTDLPPGVHGFHVHQNASCSAGEKDGKQVPGLAAGGHYDPAATAKHEGPSGAGHLGDLPALTAGADGTATQPVSALRLKLADVAGRSLMIHAGGDTYSDMPAPLGGGGARLACGVIK